MKKYIRTKDGRIFEIEKDLGKYGKSKAVIICDFNGNFIDVEKQNMILKQADTIEELCDEFVYLMESGKHICKSKHTDIMYCFDEDKPLSYYGAIWTDKGLIYVAKMNEKGELELL